MIAAPSFEDFYEAIHDRPPFPWQVALSELAATSAWPAEVGVPTGLGKTSVIDVAVWALAAQADRGPSERTAPTRIWYVVNRRLLVDAGYDHAARLAGLLATTLDGPIGDVARRLGSMGATTYREGPLQVQSLRGGVAPSRPQDPSRPTVISSTVPMFGSRLLFRGYGASRRMAPLDAALAGIDSLILLDEAHLSGPLLRLLGSIPECDANRGGALRAPSGAVWSEGPAELLPVERARPRVVSLTATGRATDRFDLTEADRQHPVVVRRLSAVKPTKLVETSLKDLPLALAEEALSLMAGSGDARAGVVFVNSPSTALAVAAELGTFDGDVRVLTGRLREPDAASLRIELLAPETGAPAGRTEGPVLPLLVVATQTLEVGADLDFDVLVTETAGARALTQRFGRLNRLGDRPWAVAAVVHPGDAKEWAVYGEEPRSVWKRLCESGPLVDLAPRDIAAVIGEPRDSDSAAPELLGFHLWEFAKTWTRPTGSAPPELFFSGLGDLHATVSVAWRVAPGSGRLWVAPGPSETIEVPLGEVRRIWDAEQEVLRLSSRGDERALEVVEVAALSPGDVVMLDVAFGGYGRNGWDPMSSEAVFDLSPLVTHQFAIAAETLENLLWRSLSIEEVALIDQLSVDPEGAPDPLTDESVGEALLGLLQNEPRPDPAPEHLWRWGSVRRARVERRSETLQAWLVWELGESAGVGVEAEDDLSNFERIGLEKHCRAVGLRAELIASSLGLPRALGDALAAAGRLHDLGKADPRFQGWLGRGLGDPLLAKSKASWGGWDRLRVQSQWPHGGRHELLSLQAISAAEVSGVVYAEADLIRHLVATHHGRGRPLLLGVGSEPVEFTVPVDAADVVVAGDVAASAWDQPERFRLLSERFGHWGLALMETILRQADHLESSEVGR